jgi:SAM-dependent methyltransferase
VTTYEGDACDINFYDQQLFDVIFQSTVFTSLLDDKFKERLATKMWTLLKPGGIVLWYDFMFDNPKNKDVKGIKKNEIRKLFPEAATIKFKRVTLAPPLSRRVKKLYHFFNIVPFLRTHLIAEIEK